MRNEKDVGPANWEPLERSMAELGLPMRTCGEFMWMFRQGAVNFYKHIDTRRYLLLDEQGRCFRRGQAGLEQVDFGDALQLVRGLAVENTDGAATVAGAPEIGRGPDMANDTFLNVRGVPLARTVEEYLEKSGIHARPALSVQHQNLARRFVIRGVESGGAIEEAGRYVTFADEDGRPIAWLQPVDTIARNSVHSVVIAQRLVRIEMFRAGRTYDLCITRHWLQAGENGARPKLTAEEIFAGRSGYLGLELWGKDKALSGSVVPQFFTTAGEEAAIPPQFLAAVRAATGGATCRSCSHSHYLIPPDAGAATPNCQGANA